MTTHSPHPWKAEPIGHGAYGIWDSLGQLVAETRTTEDTSVDKRPGSPSRPEAGQANRKLLTVAPELLAFAQLVSDFFDNDSAGHGHYLKEQAEIAIAKTA
jgi:hypothetical protein